MDFHLEKERPLIDKTKFGVFDGIPHQFYETIILPNLSNLAKTCGLIFSQAIKNQAIKSYCGTENKEVDVLHFEWPKEDYLVYPIAPKPIKESENLGSTFYKMYEDQVLCDFKFTCQDDKIFQVHSSILYVNGGPVLQKMLTGAFKESQEKSITFESYSSNTIADFIKFAYLGGKAFSDQYISSASEEADIFELFRFAHELQVSPLVDCCTNLISLLATPENKDDIKKLASQYDNEHLQQLLTHLEKTA
jgi:hypothetical protein